MHTNSISERADMPHILNYIVNNYDTGIRDHSVSPEEQYKNELDKLSEFLYEKYGEDMQEEIWEDISELIYACRELFFEIGFREGIKLERQITSFVNE